MDFNILPIIASYPPNSLESYLKKIEPKRLRIFIDLRNVQTGLFVDDIVREIVNNTEINQCLDNTIFQDLLKYVCWWKKFGNSKGLETSIYISNDIGSSVYHKEIHKEYKAERVHARAMLPEYYKDLTGIRQKNDEICENVFNRLPNIHYFKLKFLECDFLHYWLITRKFQNDDDSLNIICSNDKDMYQSLILPNVIQIYSLRGNKYIIDEDNCLQTYTKSSRKTVKSKMRIDEYIKNIDKGFIPAIMSFVGDKSDGVPGINKIGPMNSIKFFADKDFVEEYIGTVDELDNRVFLENKFFKKDEYDSKYGKLLKTALENEEVLVNAYKMISYEMLCRWLEMRNNTTKIEWTKYIDSVLRKEKVMTSGKLFYDVICKKIPNFSLNEEYINNIF